MPEEQPKESAGSVTQDRLAQVQGRIDTLAKLIQQYEMARVARRRTNMCISIVVLLIVLGFTAVFISPIYSFLNSKKEQQEFVGELQAQMITTESSTLHEFINMVREVAPVYAGEVKKQFNEQWPDIRTKLKSEGDKFLADVMEQAKARFKETMEKVAKGAEDRLQIEFKDLKNGPALRTVMGNVEKALENAALDVFQARAQKARERMMAVQEKALDFAPPGSSETLTERMSKIWDQFLQYDVGVTKKEQP